MFKKILIGVIFIGLMAVLVWGGVNRTLAKTESLSNDHGGRNWDAGNQVNPNGTRGQDRIGSEDLNEDREYRGYRDQVTENDTLDNNPLVDEDTSYNRGARFGNNGREGFARGPQIPSVMQK